MATEKKSLFELHFTTKHFLYCCVSDAGGNVAHANEFRRGARIQWNRFIEWKTRMEAVHRMEE